MKKITNVLKYLVMLGVGVFLFWLVFRDIDFRQILVQIDKIQYGYMVLAFFVALLAHWSRGARWVLLIKPLGFKVSNLNGFLAVMVGYFANLALPRMGEVSRCLVLNRTNKVPVDKLIGTVVVERIVDVISLLIILALNLALEFSKLKKFFIDFFNNLSAKNQSLFTTTTAVIAITSFVFIIVVGIFIFRRFRKSKLFLKLANTLKGFVSGLQTIWLMENKWLFIFHSILIWTAYYFMVYICFLAMDVTSQLGPVVALSVLVMGSFGFVAPVQGGVGAYHAIVTVTLMQYGLSEASSAAFALVAHTFQTLVVVVVGSLSYLMLTLMYKKIAKHDTLQASTAESLS